MAVIGWRFPPLSGGTRQGYTNNDIEAFKGEELIDNLAREICQNSLDAKMVGSNLTEPVKVTFELKEIPTDLYKAFSEYKKCIDGCRRYWGTSMDAKLSRFLNDAEEMLAKDKIPVLVAGDYGTLGLSGSRSRSLSSAWEALTGADGMSVKNAETSGGSFGIGKNAPFACSALSMVFYNTFASDGEKAFIGVSRLATLLDENNKETQRVGKYQSNDNENEKWTPIFSENEDSFRDLFQRNETGTDVIIAGFNQEVDWMKNITKAVLKNFFVAIAEGKLVVELKECSRIKTIKSDNLSQTISDLSEDGEMAVTSQLYKAFSSPDRTEKFKILEDNDVDVYIKSDASFSRTIANFRDTGMLVGLKSRRIFQHYAAVVIVRGEELGELLRATEPPRHNRWDYKLINGISEKEKRKSAKKSIELIDQKLLDLLKNQFEVVTEDTVDAAGVGEYLPDDLDGLGGASEGDDILKVKVKIGKVKTIDQNKGIISVQGTKAIGEEENGTIHNHEKNPDPLPPKPHPPRPVRPSDEEETEGAMPGKGTKSVITPNLSAQRAFPINASIGLYKIVIKPQEHYDNLFIRCLAVGEDGKKDYLDIESFTYSSKHIPVNDNQAGPISVEKDIPASFFVTFKSKEKMVLNLQMWEDATK